MYILPWVTLSLRKYPLHYITLLTFRPWGLFLWFFRGRWFPVWLTRDICRHFWWSWERSDPASCPHTNKFHKFTGEFGKLLGIAHWGNVSEKTLAVYEYIHNKTWLITIDWTEAEFQTLLKRFPDSSVSSIIRSCLTPGKASDNQNIF